MDAATNQLDGITVYLDDVLVSLRSRDEYCRHHCALFAALSRYGLVINPAKCAFGKTELDFINAKVARPILGIDFLSRFGFLIDCKKRMLLHRSGDVTPFTVPRSLNKIQGIHLVKSEATNVFEKILEESRKLQIRS